MKRTFEEWKKAVDVWVIAQLGLSADDLPDVDYYSWWRDGLSPKTAASRLCKMAMSGEL